ncbi:DUF971 domain-containing protein [Stieleria sp. TO1_6]|uniref:DUF971 domain-containing protein n=1 Tax=Stieleria tagensis TaxID=2956795 RepID=UPI00209AE210|nr:DUF971 domain-containing protein [Stieleria tagensis]MCO8121743.1 DUF971 domain-containing protein [Stieleria tagensis]
MNVLPESISRDGDSTIVISWTDGRQTRCTASQLRAICPCATCREKKRAKLDDAGAGKPIGLPVLKAAEAQPLTITAMRPVGSYAYNIAFSDGHSSGLFQLSTLYDLAPAQT